MSLINWIRQPSLIAHELLPPRTWLPVHPSRFYTRNLTIPFYSLPFLAVSRYRNSRLGNPREIILYFKCFKPKGRKWQSLLFKRVKISLKKYWFFITPFIMLYQKRLANNFIFDTNDLIDFRIYWIFHADIWIATIKACIIIRLDFTDRNCNNLQNFHNCITQKNYTNFAFQAKHV